jgi:ribosome biogenesis GTPase
MQGIIYSGINNIYRVKDSEDREFLCRIKGKTLGKSREEYNPLAVGDQVVFQQDTHDSTTGLIDQRLERKNRFLRYNQKGRSPQTIAVNIDLLLCFTSPDEPPFRPRFLDRVMISAEWGGVEPVIVVNKSDQSCSEGMTQRLDAYKAMGYQVLFTSAVTQQGIDQLNGLIKDKQVAVFGQSGVGKSTLLNLLEPGINLKTAELSTKHNRGKHTTNFSIMVDRKHGGRIIDTPGIRQIFLWGIEPGELGEYFRDFSDYKEHCGFRGCLHRSEPNCAVTQALKEEKIHHDRYESYLRILEDLETL